MNIGWEIAKIVFYLAMVVGLIYLLNYFFKKNITRAGSGKYVKVIEQVYLSPKKSLVLIAVHDKILLLSNNEDKIRTLEKWEKGDFVLKEDELTDGQSFKEYWQQILKKNRRDKDG